MCVFCPLSRYFDDFEVPKTSVIDDEAYKCPNLMPTLQTCCSGIDVKQSQTLVVLHLEDVTVA